MEHAANIWMPASKPIVPRSPLIPTLTGLEWAWDELDRVERRLVDKLRRGGQSLKDRMLLTGSDTNYLSKKFGDLIFGATAYTAPVTVHLGLWSAALDDTSTGSTASEGGYTSYARLALTNNTTIFATGSGTTTYVKTFPSDALKSWASSTGGGTPAFTYLGVCESLTVGNMVAWASVTSVTINNGDTPQIAQNAFSQTRD